MQNDPSYVTIGCCGEPRELRKDWSLHHADACRALVEDDWCPESRGQLRCLQMVERPDLFTVDRLEEDITKDREAEGAAALDAAEHEAVRGVAEPGSSAMQALLLIQCQRSDKFPSILQAPVEPSPAAPFCDRTEAPVLLRH